MKAFSSLDAIREADVQTLAALPAMNQQSAQSVYDFFHRQNVDGGGVV